MRLKILSLIIFYLIGIQFTLAKDITGVWKTVDDKSGFSFADVLITKNDNGTFSGKIIVNRSVPGKTNTGLCTGCDGVLKGKAVNNIQVLSNFIENPKNINEYIDGKIFDPVSGNIYKGRIKLAKDGNRLILRGYLGTSMLGRNQTWIRLN
ncbi:DUF2147 domain-containing protein [Acinetobacter modestus]|uniref:DUF2147 domain-containing protein n=1 Tax=Acinetobacter modestus TaxID=1776740 RepID=UPI0032090987